MTHVFVGPSLPKADVRRILPSATVHPPIRHGDLARIGTRPGDTVLIIDGLFLHSAAVRHKEITALFADGVTVAGASSMGALRAAELSPIGMRGVGLIFDLYRDGVIDGDDEVAIVHGDHDTGHRPLSEPMVNIRLDLARARAARVLNDETHDVLLGAAKSLPFRQRGLAELTRAAYDLLPRHVASAFAAWLSAHHVDTKARDARELLELAARGAPAIRPPDSNMPSTNHDTVYGAGWALEFGGRMVDGTWITHADAVALVAICDPDFPRRFRTAVLTALTNGPEASAEDPPPGTAVVEVRALAAARKRGLLGPGGELAASCNTWLTATECDLPGDEAVLRVLVRAYGSRPAAQAGIIPSLLPGDATQWYRQAAAVRGFADLALGRRYAGAARDVRRPTVTAIDRFCADLWGCPEADLTAAAADRGFPTREHARRAAADLTMHARWFAIERRPVAPTDHLPASTMGSHQ